MSEPDGGYGEGGNRDRTVYAAADGKIETMGWESSSDHKKGYGYRIKLRSDEDQSLFVYGHMDPDSIVVSRGSHVVRGQYLGKYADPTNGSSTAPHLHFEHWSAKGRLLDPTPYLSTALPNYSITSGMGNRVHPMTGKIRRHNGYDVIGPILMSVASPLLNVWPMRFDCGRGVQDCYAP